MKLPRTPFWYLRHGETDYNAKGWSQGATEMPLNENGRAQAAAAAPLLAGQGIAAIVSSPMLRTRQTTEIVNAVLNLPVSYEPDLHEVIFGGMEGKPLQPWFTEWMEGRATPEGAESFAALTARVEVAMTRVLALPGPLLIIAHGGIFRAVRDLMGLNKEGLTPNGVPLFCQPSPTGWKISTP
jgi:broad specificity phosphatase PhoE